MGKRFLIRNVVQYSQFSVGVASVMIEQLLHLRLHFVTEAENAVRRNGTISEAPALDKLPDDVLKAIEKAEKEAEVSQQRMRPLLMKKRANRSRNNDERQNQQKKPLQWNDNWYEYSNRNNETTRSH